MQKICLISALFLACLTGSIAAAAEVRVVASFERAQVVVGEETFLTIKILDGHGNIQAPNLPPLSDLDVHYTGRASRMSLVNGVSSSSIEFSYAVLPRRAGTFVIPSVAVMVNGVLFKTNAVQIWVVDDGSGGGLAAPAASSAFPTRNANTSQPVVVSQTQPPTNADTRIFAEAQLSKFSVYQNEQTLLNYALFTSYDTRYEGFETEPELSGFWIEEFPQEKEVPRQMVSIGGRRYIKADIRKMALFPTAPGKYKINPGQIKTTVKQDQQQNNVFDEFFNDSFFNGGNFFSKRENKLLTPRSLEIEVKPLPEVGKPSGFQGDVGQYQMSATLDHSEVKQNEPVKMILVIQGTGNVDRVNRPRVPDLKGFRTYEADSKSEISRVNDMISGRKIFEVVFIPRDEGKMFIPPLEFSFFDPLTAKYQVLRTPNFPLHVLKGEDGPALPDAVTEQPELKKQVQVQSNDIRFVEINQPRKNGEDQILKFAIPILGFLNTLFLGLIGWTFYQKKLELLISKNPGAYRNKRARATVMNEINSLQKLITDDDIASQTEFFEYLERSMNQYFADKWDLSAYGTARSEILRKLNETLGEEDIVTQEVSEVYQLCDESRFGRGSIPQSSKELALRIFLDVVNRLEKIK